MGQEAAGNPDGATRVVAWEKAAGAVQALIASMAPVPRVIVGITGPVGSGKSTLAARLGGCVIATDSYLPDYEGLPEHERDLPERADLARLAADLGALRRGGWAEVPVWSFVSHRREGYRRVEASPLIVCEGIHALHESVAEQMDVRVYVDASRGTRWGRWERIELAGERGMGVEAARRHFELIAEPTFARYGESYRAGAHIVVIND